MEEMNCVDIIGTRVSVTNPERALHTLEKNLEAWRGKYIVACNVHAVVTAHDNIAFREAENGAVIALPDGKPLCMVQRRRGYPEAGHVPITTLMDAILADSTVKGYRHYFYGSTAETQQKLIEQLSTRYPGISVVGSEPSVFRPLTGDEKEALFDRINLTKPDFVWVGLGVPRQELFMMEAQGRIHALMLGVGGGFDVLAGNVKRAPLWMQKACLEWLYRLLQEPKRLLKRYLVTNSRFLLLIRKDRAR